jgi:hypothetical protein
MQLSKLLLSFLAAGLLIAGIGCKKSDVSVKTSTVALTLTIPGGLQSATTSNLVVTLREVNTNIITTPTFTGAGPYTITLPQGSYEVTLEADIKYTDESGEHTSKVRGYQKDIAVTGDNATISLPLFLYNTTAKFVFKEIFFTGTTTPEGKTYNGDKYFILYNNSADTLYADRLIISEAAFLTTTKRQYTPDIMAETFSGGSVVMIPGNGKDYPVLPGKQLVIANNAINHKAINANSIDLSKAEFELTLLPAINVDNPQVPDLINITSAMTMHNRGFKTYVIARMPADMTVDAYKTQNTYQYSYTNSAGNITTQSAYKIPNTWIMDAVNLSVASVFEWILVAPSLDMGWSYCGKVDSDASRYSKAVRRKVLSTNPDGRVILKDNNNSTVDLEPEVKPSLMP